MIGRAKNKKRKIIKSINEAIAWLRMAKIDILEKKLDIDSVCESHKETVEMLKSIKEKIEYEMKEFIEEIDKAIKEFE